MKACSFLSLAFSLVVLACANSLAEEAEVAVGDEVGKVLSVLGTPQGRIQAGSVELLYYERGLVEVHDGKVVMVSLLSEEEAAERRLLRERERALAAAAEITRREARVREGLELKHQMLTNPEFLRAPAADRLDFWKDFARTYPDVPIEAVYARTLAEWEEDVVRRQEGTDAALRNAVLEQRLSDMEQRLDESEDRLRESELRPARWSYHAPRHSSQGWDRFSPAGPEDSGIIRYDGPNLLGSLSDPDLGRRLSHSLDIETSRRLLPWAERRREPVAGDERSYTNEPHDNATRGGRHW